MIDGQVPTTTAIADLHESSRPTLDNLLRHFNKYGLDNSIQKDRRGRKTVGSYTSFKKFSDDALVKTGRAYLGQNAYGFLVESVGYPQFKDQAVKHWQTVRDEAGA